MNNRTKTTVIFVILAVVLIVTSVVFDFGLIKFFDNELTNSLFCSTMSRAIGSLLFIYVVKMLYSERAFSITNGGLRGLLWCVPCILVAFANFPYSALITGKASIVRTDIFYLYVFFTITTAIYEELVFRGTLVFMIKGFFINNQHKNLFTVLITSALFALLHSLNFMVGFSLDVLLQIGYTFLLGCMLSSVYLYTKNLYICIGIHAIFNFGGLLIATIGEGYNWDVIFWILTGVCGVFCAVHVIFTVIKLDKKESYVS